MFIPHDFAGMPLNYSINTISDQALSYYVEEKNKMVQLIYSYSPVTFNMTFYEYSSNDNFYVMNCLNNKRELLYRNQIQGNNSYSCNNTNYISISLGNGKIEFSKFSFDNPLISNEGLPQYDDGKLKARWPQRTPEITPPDTNGNNNNNNDNDDHLDQNNSSGNKLSGGAIAGIVVGVIVVIAVCIAAFIIIHKRKPSSSNADIGDEV
ncbi:hypothetical protein TVAG_463530 [Trichomonas vaginalis G3]|uniref:Uncharacterized protein n=1 Tax=Trichomonas vaginalis (strain ATCC PRA-98 / G3) TaxID=412133 RepID=A2EH25_TRIV3|nr:hypothetical protein TVAGG3_0077740 [Trichomonas vaginalis G3]EAY08073.1 hypothetical protein TVAG_463530 [Trichomonas vaginalis G3]KAI5543010.1 hypothetical protein TVAGG3_0077740 [Trichomonas vaginalis G3]|eukprot:XP_001320296.1 hypothetical protein [Trichomonas vaginalis G3]